MLAQTETIEPSAMTEATHKASFFRQSGWMVITTVAGGAFMFLVNFLSSKYIPATEYSALGALIQVLNWVTIPAIGLQTTFAHQTSAAITDAQQRQLFGTVWAVTRGIFFIWLAMLTVAIIWHGPLQSSLKLGPSSIALWLTMATGLMMLLLPIWQGLLQGRQNFLWLGWAAVFNAMGRVVIAGTMVFLLGYATAAGVMVGAFSGFAAAVSVAFWQNRDAWSRPRDPFESRSWLRKIIPLSIGCGASQFLFSADAIVVTNYMGSNGAAAPYMIGGTLARGIVLFTAPLVAVMFPKLVHSAAHKQKSNLMLWTLLGTAGLAGMAAVGLTLTSGLLIRIFSKPEYASIVPLIPLFAWSMVPLAVANVLMNNLMAHSRFKCAPALAVVTVGYWVALQYFHGSFKMVIEVLGVFNVIFLIVCMFFTWAIRDEEPVVTPLNPPEQEPTL
jgi:O-antigen/teichoic acid export membrane protein